MLHVDSGSEFGHMAARTTIDCRVAAADAVNCTLGTLDSAAGDPHTTSGLEGRNHKFRVYAGLRDDPFYNNIEGLLGAYQAAAWKTIPSWFLYGSLDKNIPPAAHAFMAERAGAREVIEVKGASRVVMITHSEALVKLVDAAAQAIR